MSAFTYGTIYTGRVDPSMTSATTEVKRQLEDVYAHTMTIGHATERMSTVSTRAFRGYIFGLQMSIFYTSMLANAWMRAESAQLSLEDAQENYQRTLEEFGPTHEKTEAALRRLERAQLMVQRTSLTTMLSVGGLTLQMGSMAVQTLVATGALSGYSLATATATAQEWLHVAALKAKAGILTVIQALSGPSGWAKLALAGALIGGGILGGYALGGGFSRATTSTEINVNVNAEGATSEDLMRALDEANQRAKYELRRSTGG